MRNDDILADGALDAANPLSPEGIRRALGDGTTGSRGTTRFGGDGYSADLASPMHATSVKHGATIPAVEGRWTLERKSHHSTFLPGRGEHMGITTTSQQHGLNSPNRSQSSVDTQPSNTYLLFHHYHTTTSLTLSHTCIGWTMLQRPSTPALSPWGILGRTLCRLSILFAVAVGIGPTQQATVIHTGRIWDGAPQEGGPIRLPTIHQVDKKLDVGVWLAPLGSASFSLTRSTRGTDSWSSPRQSTRPLDSPGWQGRQGLGGRPSGLAGAGMGEPRQRVNPP